MPPQPPDPAVRHRDDERWMADAITAARRQPSLPFGAVLVDEARQRLVATGWNQGASDPTAHGEIDVIRRAAQQASPPDWASLTLYTTAEPCPMCAGAIVWAGIGRVVYGVSIPWLTAQGWAQLDLRAEAIFARALRRRVALSGGVLEPSCAALFRAATATEEEEGDSSSTR